MRRLPPSAVAAVWSALFAGLLPPAAGFADVVTLKDGTRLEGSLSRTDDGYDVTKADGKVVRVRTAQIRSVEAKPQATPEDAKRRLDSLRRNVESMSDIKLILSRYSAFLRLYGATPQADVARKDIAFWEDRLQRHMTKAGGKWVTPEQLGALREQSQETAVKARDLVSQGRLREAGPLIQQSLDLDPKNASALYLRGVVAFRQDQLGPARKAFEQVAQVVPDHAPTLNNLAVIYWRQQNVPAALRSYDAAVVATGPANGVGGAVTEAVLNNVAEALHALPKNLRGQAAAKKLVLHFQEREEALAKKMKERGFYRWGANWVDADQLDKLQAKEKAIEAKIKELEAEFEVVQKRIDAIDHDITDTERAMRRMEATSYVRDPATGRVGRLAPPPMYQGLLRDLEELKRERAGQESIVAALRRDAKAAKQELPVPRYTGTQRIIDADGAPLMAGAAKRAAPAL